MLHCKMFNVCGKLYWKRYHYRAGTVTFSLAALECQTGLLQKSYFSQKLSHKFREKSLCYFLMPYSANLGIFWIFSSFLLKKPLFCFLISSIPNCFFKGNNLEEFTCFLCVIRKPSQKAPRDCYYEHFSSSENQAVNWAQPEAETYKMNGLWNPSLGYAEGSHLVRSPCQCLLPGVTVAGKTSNLC